jgi:hypothetical protein
VAAREQCDQRKFHGFGFALDHLLDLSLQPRYFFGSVKSRSYIFAIRPGLAYYPISHHFFIDSAAIVAPYPFYKILVVLCITKLTNGILQIIDARTALKFQKFFWRLQITPENY